jgi:hypothetical protein
MPSFPIRHEHSATVDGTVDAAWRLLDDVARYPEWVGVTLAVLEPVPAAAVPGAVYRERTRLVGPITTTAVWTVVARDDEALHQRHECADTPGPIRSMWIELGVTGGPVPVVTLVIGCEVVAGPLTRPLGRLLSHRLAAENERNVQRFARLLATQRTDRQPADRAAPGA